MARTWVLLRGLVREQKHWENFPSLLQAAHQQDRVITLDLPGNGLFYNEKSPKEIGQMVAHIRAQLNSAGVTGPVHVVALSLGAMMAVQWLRQASNEVAFAALINTSASRFSPFWERLRPANYSRLLCDAVFSRDAVKKEKAILDITLNLHSEETRSTLAHKWAGYAELQPVSLKNSLRQLYAAMRFRAPSSLPESVPVVLINGAGDRLVSPACSQDLAQAWQVPLKVHPRAGHDLPFDDPQWLIDTLTDAVTDFGC